MGDDVIAMGATGVIEDGTEEESASCLEVRALALRDLTPTYTRQRSYVSFQRQCIGMVTRRPRPRRGREGIFGRVRHY
jgi:hypothetical protein